MLFILHGDNAISSRDNLNQQIQTAKQNNIQDIIHLDGKKVDLTQLIQSLESNSFFGTDKLVIIENLHKRPKSKLKTELIGYLKSLDPQTSPQTLIWEEKSLTNTQLKALGNPKHQEFKLPKSLFSFLDSVKPQNHRQAFQLLDQTLSTEPEGLVFAMLIRQTRLLIQAKDNTLKISPWQAKKLTAQASQFSQTQLLKLHKQLLTIDSNIKTGHNLTSLKESLDFVISTL